MRRSTGPHPIPILLIAFAIQGAMPDSRDLASLRALNLVCMILTDLDPASNNSDSSENVCGSARFGNTAEIRELIKRRPSSAFEVRSTSPSMDRGALSFLSLLSSIARIDDVIHRLCRLTC